MSVEQSSEVWHRDDLAYLCMWRRLYKVAEIGVDRGIFAETFLSRWIGTDYWGIDSYESYPEMPYDRTADYLMALQRLAPHAGRFKLLKWSSEEAAKFFADGSLDFAYIDGAHDYESVRRDLRLWWSKLSEKGILAGHDFDDQPHHEGVKRAVTEFGREVGRTVYLTAVEGFQREECPSWYTYKNGIPGPEWRRC